MNQGLIYQWLELRIYDQGGSGVAMRIDQRYTMLKSDKQAIGQSVAMD
jgi:hypothetical protein